MSGCIPWELSLDAPVSIRAEGAWRVTRGSPTVIVAIIDEGFDTSQLRNGAQVDVVRVTSSPPRSTGHGTAMAGLIVGTRAGYPGVAPECRILAIELPAICRAEEEATAFDIAFERNAAVVCCAWGSPASLSKSELPEVVRAALEQLRYSSRHGLGAIVCFAAPNRTGVDCYASADVLTVAGVTVDGLPVPPLVGGRTVVRAPVSHPRAWTGGFTALPLGTSVATALAAGVAALAMSANTRLAATDVADVLRQSMKDGLLDSLIAVRLAQSRGTLRPATTLSAHRATPVHADTLRVHERRFNGGEHFFLGDLASGVLSNTWELSHHKPETAFFGPPFDVYTFEDVKPQYTPEVASAIAALFDANEGLQLPARARREGIIEYGYLTALAADVCPLPDDLLREIRRDGGEVRDICNYFRAEFNSGFRGEFDPELVKNDIESNWNDDDGIHYRKLAERNPSHFAGENLLYYLSFHFGAITAAAEAASLAAAAAAERLQLAIATEAFASHFLCDMFSASHARVPRRQILRSYNSDMKSASFVSRLFHQHEGRLGVFLRNAIGQVWYAFGDTGVRRGTDVLQITADLAAWSNDRDPLKFLPRVADDVAAPIRPEHLAASLVFASLLDLFRHAATPVTPDDTARGSVGYPHGLLGYIMDRVPYALSNADMSDELRAKFQTTYGDRFATMSMGSRVANQAAWFETYQKDKTIGFIDPETYDDLTEFGAKLPGMALTQSFAWAAAMPGYLKGFLGGGGAPPVLLKVPGLLNDPLQPVRQYPDWIRNPKAVPPNWRAAIPDGLVSALVGARDVWYMGR